MKNLIPYNLFEMARYSSADLYKDFEDNVFNLNLKTLINGIKDLYEDLPYEMDVEIKIVNEVHKLANKNKYVLFTVFVSDKEKLFEGYSYDISLSVLGENGENGENDVFIGFNVDTKRLAALQLDTKIQALFRNEEATILEYIKKNLVYIKPNIDFIKNISSLLEVEKLEKDIVRILSDKYVDVKLSKFGYRFDSSDNAKPLFSINFKINEEYSAKIILDMFFNNSFYNFKVGKSENLILHNINYTTVLFKNGEKISTFFGKQYNDILDNISGIAEDFRANVISNINNSIQTIEKAISHDKESLKLRLLNFLNDIFTPIAIEEVISNLNFHEDLAVLRCHILHNQRQKDIFKGLHDDISIDILKVDLEFVGESDQELYQYKYFDMIFGITYDYLKDKSYILVGYNRLNYYTEEVHEIPSSYLHDKNLFLDKFKEIVKSSTADLSQV